MNNHLNVLPKQASLDLKWSNVPLRQGQLTTLFQTP